MEKPINEFYNRFTNINQLKKVFDNSVLGIINRLMKMVHYKLVKTIINALGLTKIKINVLIHLYSLLDSIVTNESILFTSKFW